MNVVTVIFQYFNSFQYQFLYTFSKHFGFHFNVHFASLNLIKLCRCNFAVALIFM